MTDYQKLYSARKRDRAGAFLGAAGIIGLLLLTYTAAAKEETVPLTQRVGCRECHKMTDHAKLAAYLKAKGSPVPAKMATAILKQPIARQPILTKIAVAESNANPYLRNYGYKKAHSGAWGVNERLHGRVSSDPCKQAEQAGKYFSELLKMTDGNLQQALSIYGGDSSKKRWYASNILKDLEEATP